MRFEKHGTTPDIALGMWVGEDVFPTRKSEAPGYFRRVRALMGPVCSFPFLAAYDLLSC